MTKEKKLGRAYIWVATTKIYRKDISRKMINKRSSIYIINMKIHKMSEIAKMCIELILKSNEPVPNTFESGTYLLNELGRVPIFRTWDQHF